VDGQLQPFDIDWDILVLSLKCVMAMPNYGNIPHLVTWSILWSHSSVVNILVLFCSVLYILHPVAPNKGIR
jgi:hypothetical protein